MLLGAPLATKVPLCRNHGKARAGRALSTESLNLTYSEWKKRQGSPQKTTHREDSSGSHWELHPVGRAQLMQWGDVGIAHWI